MPNHTTNIMTLTGPREELERFMFTVSSKNPAIRQRQKDSLEALLASAQADFEKDPSDLFAKMHISDAQKGLGELDKLDCILDFSGTLPMPVELEGTKAPMDDKKQAASNIAKYGAPDWYEWKNQFWGTKWGCYDVEPLEDNGTDIVYHYQTAWSPALPWIIHTSGLFPELTITISAKDEGDGYFLVYKYKDGECIDQQDMESHDWLMEYDEEYAAVYTNIFEIGYDDGIKYAIEMGHTDWRTEEKLLEFIQDDDLPLFINFEWQHDDVKELYSKRLKTLNKTGVEKERKEEKRSKKSNA